MDNDLYDKYARFKKVLKDSTSKYPKRRLRESEIMIQPMLDEAFHVMTTDQFDTILNGRSEVGLNYNKVDMEIWYDVSRQHGENLRSDIFKIVEGDDPDYLYFQVNQRRDVPLSSRSSTGLTCRLMFSFKATKRNIDLIIPTLENTLRERLDDTRNRVVNSDNKSRYIREAISTIFIILSYYKNPLLFKVLLNDEHSTLNNQPTADDLTENYILNSLSSIAADYLFEMIDDNTRIRAFNFSRAEGFMIQNDFGYKLATMLYKSIYSLAYRSDMFKEGVSLLDLENFDYSIIEDTAHLKLIRQLSENIQELIGKDYVNVADRALFSYMLGENDSATSSDHPIIGKGYAGLKRMLNSKIKIDEIDKELNRRTSLV